MAGSVPFAPNSVEEKAVEELFMDFYRERRGGVEPDESEQSLRQGDLGVRRLGHKVTMHHFRPAVRTAGNPIEGKHNGVKNRGLPRAGIPCERGAVPENRHAGPGGVPEIPVCKRRGKK